MNNRSLQIAAIRAGERERVAAALEKFMPDSRCQISCGNAAAIVRAMEDQPLSDARESVMTGRDAALARIDQMRKKLRDDFWRDMAKLDAHERELLGLRPLAQLRRDYDPEFCASDEQPNNKGDLK